MNKLFPLFLLFVLLFLMVSSWDYADEVRSEQHYTNMVCSDLWPDFLDLTPNCATAEDMRHDPRN